MLLCSELANQTVVIIMRRCWRFWLTIVVICLPVRYVSKALVVVVPVVSTVIAMLAVPEIQ